MFVCGTALASEKGMEDRLESNINKAKELLKEANYDGTPIVLLHSTDLQVLTNLAPVAKSLMEKAGFKVDMHSSDWQSVVARRVKKDPANAGGWHAMLTSWVSADILNPVMTGFVNAGCDKAMFGWPCDAELEKLRDDFAKATDPAKQKEIAEKRADARGGGGHPHPPRAVVPGPGGAQERHRHPDLAGAGVLEREQVKNRNASLRAKRNPVRRRRRMPPSARRPSHSLTES